MYLVEAYNTPKEYEESITARFFKNLQIAEVVTRAELWGTSFEDPGPDYTELRLFDGTNRLVASHRHWGY